MASRRSGALAGPILIVASVIGVLHTFALRSLLSTSDVLRFWMPTYCYLGRTLASGHIPAWNPHVMGGVPFAADPQSGWMYLPAMALFTTLPCGLAIRSMIVLLPALAGLGVYAFLRGEALSRPASTLAGVTLGLSIAGSEIGLSLPFAGTLAWTALMLAASSRCLQARTSSRRVLWCLLTAALWGQLAATHFSIGLLMGTLALLGYLVAKSVQLRRAGTLTGGEVARVLVLMAVSLPVVNLAYLVPRLAYLPETSLGLGYARLQELSTLVAGRRVLPFAIGRASAPTWPLRLATAPGAHLGALALGLAFAGWWAKRFRHLVVAFAALGAVCYVLTLHVVAFATPDALRAARPVSFYLHYPEWFAYAVVLAIAVLAGVGLEAFRTASSARQRVLMIIPGVVVWGILPLVFERPITLLLVGAGAAVGGLVLWLGVRRPALFTLAPLALAAELVVAGSVGRPATPPRGVPTLLGVRSVPSVDPSRLLEPGPILGLVKAQDGGRLVTLSGVPLGEEAGMRVLIPNLSMAYGTEDISTFNPVELLRYWIYARAAQGREIIYNRTFFVSIPAVASDLFQVRWVIARKSAPPPAARVAPVAREGGWVLYRLSGTPPPASVVGSWSVVPFSPGAFPSPSLRDVLAPGFDPERSVVVERDPAVGPLHAHRTRSGRAGTLTYRATTAQDATIVAEATRAALVLVRTPFDPNWRATVDGRPARLLRADYLFQAVAVARGHHVIQLRYDDPWIGYGLGGSAVAVGLLLLGALLLRGRAVGERNRVNQMSTPAVPSPVPAP